MKGILSALLILCLLISGCSLPAKTEEKQYTATFLDLFDTVTTIIGRAESEAAFREKAQSIHDDLQYYHRLFDIYNDYEGVVNLKTVNEMAGIQPVKVEKAVIELLLACKEYCHLTDGNVNVAMGSVLALWHNARTDGIRDPQNAKLPSAEALQEAALHTDIDCVQIEEGASTVYITDPKVRLDVGAIAKGWATQRVAEKAPSGLLISVGGNVCATGPKRQDGTAWVIGIQDPDQADKNLHTLYLTKGSVVTSGDYQRTYWVEGKAYHHIIDPQTLMPATKWRSVSIVCPDSGLADALSTGLFLMDYEQGKALAQKCGAEVLWVSTDGTEHMTPGFEKSLRN